MAKAVIGNSNVQFLEESEMARLYYTMYNDYYGERRRSVPKQLNKRSIALWRRVVLACLASGVPSYDYMKAQFDYFHKTFRTTPSFEHLATDKAIERAQQYDKHDRRVVAVALKAKFSTQDILRRCEEMMRDMMRGQKMSREQVYQNFVLPGLVSFPKEFLDADPTWKDVNGASSV